MSLQSQVSLSSQFKRAQTDAHDKQRAASLEKIGNVCKYLADHFPDAAQGIAARAVKGKEKTWFQKRKTEKWVWNLKALTTKEITDAPDIFFNALPNFLKLRDACAAQEMDIRLWVHVSSGPEPSIFFSVDPTQPFSASVFSVNGDKNIPLTGPAAAAAPAPAEPATPAVSAETKEKIVLMSPLRLK